jgi:hypothetical protein
MAPMLIAHPVWLVERLHVDLGRARTMLCSSFAL